MSGIRREIAETAGRTNVDLRKWHVGRAEEMRRMAKQAEELAEFIDDEVYEPDEWDDYEDEQPDVINSPQHYTQGGVEVIDIIRQATEGASGFEGYTLGNVIKYVMRYRHKNGAEDLRKAAVYLAWLTAEVEAEEKAKQDEV